MTWPMDPRIIAAAAGIAALVVLWGAWWLWWRVPKRQMRSITAADPKARADIEDNFRKTIGQLLGAAMVLVGAGGAATVAYLQLSSQQQASHELLISNQVAKGFEQLGQPGDDKVVVRLGGIYALEGVMNTSEEYHKPVLEALSAFVRDGTRTETGDGPPATDIQAALTVIGRRAAIGTGTPDLAGAHIPNANLGRAHLMGRANLSGANLTYADLSRANLGSANLSGAYLFYADLSRANLFDATISQAQLDQACGTDVKLLPGRMIKPCQK